MFPRPTELLLSDVARTADQFLFGIAPLSRGTVSNVRGLTTREAKG